MVPPRAAPALEEHAGLQGLQYETIEETGSGESPIGE